MEIPDGSYPPIETKEAWLERKYYYIEVDYETYKQFTFAFNLKL